MLLAWTWTTFQIFNTFSHQRTLTFVTFCNPFTRAMILAESGDDVSDADDEELRRKQPQRQKKTLAKTEPSSLVQLRCRCVAGNCLIQFKGMEKAIQAARDEFRGLDDGEKDKSGEGETDYLNQIQCSDNFFKSWFVKHFNFCNSVSYFHGPSLCRRHGWFQNTTSAGKPSKLTGLMLTMDAMNLIFYCKVMTGEMLW